MQILCKRVQREFTLNLPSTAKYHANILKSLEQREQFAIKLRLRVRFLVFGWYFTAK